MANRQLVIFKINGEDFGLDINQVSSIEKMLDIYKVPNTPEFVEGLVNLRGKVYTVFNLRKRFNLPSCEFDENTKIIIANNEAMTAGLIVDEVNEILNFEDTNIENAPPIMSSLNRRYINGIAKKDEKIVIILDLDSILSLTDK